MHVSRSLRVRGHETQVAPTTNLTPWANPTSCLFYSISGRPRDNFLFFIIIFATWLGRRRSEAKKLGFFSPETSRILASTGNMLECWFMKAAFPFVFCRWEGWPFTCGKLRAVEPLWRFEGSEQIGGREKRSPGICGIFPCCICCFQTQLVIYAPVVAWDRDRLTAITRFMLACLVFPIGTGIFRRRGRRYGWTTGSLADCLQVNSEGSTLLQSHPREETWLHSIVIVNERYAT